MDDAVNIATTIINDIISELPTIPNLHIIENIIPFSNSLNPSEKQNK